MRNLREQKERNEKRAKAKSKEDRVQAKKQRIKDRKSRRRQIKADKVAAELAHAAGKHAAARTIQRLVRGKQGWALLMRTLRAHRAIISLQSIVRGYIIGRQMQKVLSLRERRKAKKLVLLQAAVCLVVAFQSWLKRSRARRWVLTLREVRAALQGDERSEKTITKEECHNGIRVTRESLGAGTAVKNKPHDLRKNRRGSTLSVLAGVCIGSTIQVCYVFLLVLLLLHLTS
jgi:hypothetical protein